MRYVGQLYVRGALAEIVDLKGSHRQQASDAVLAKAIGNNPARLPAMCTVYVLNDKGMLWKYVVTNQPVGNVRAKETPLKTTLNKDQVRSVMDGKYPIREYVR